MTSSPAMESILVSIRKLIVQPQLSYCFVCFLVKRGAFASENLMYQYTSELLDVQIYQTAWLRVLQVVGAIVATNTGNPLVVSFFERGGWYSTPIHLLCVRVSLAILVFGFMCFEVATTPMFLGLGLSDGIVPKETTNITRNLSLWLRGKSRTITKCSCVFFARQREQCCVLHIRWPSRYDIESVWGAFFNRRDQCHGR